MNNIKAQAVDPFKIALVVSEFNESITKRLYEAAKQRLEVLKFSPDLITTAHVPGAIEIPIVVQRFAASKKFEAIVALGCVIRGETGHYDWVCEQVSQGCQRVGLDYKIPVIFGILTTENHMQAIARSGGEHSNKGKDAIDAACQVVSVLRQL